MKRRITPEMKCPHCPAQIAYLGEEHSCPYPELSAGDPPGPEDFGGTDEGSHYMSYQNRVNAALSIFGVHDLKTWPEYFEAVYDGSKTFDLRPNDRDFKVGDTLVLREWDPETKKYTGRRLERFISYVTDAKEFGSLTEGHVCMGFRSHDDR